MDTRIFETNYKDAKCMAMESERLLIKIIPESGSKIQSIYDKRLKKEYFVQNPSPNYIRSSYDSNFEESDMSGFDEVFPSIERCFYPSGPWKGTGVPDHGEVWALPWSCKIDKEAVFMAVNGVRFPYRLEKRVEFLQDNIIRISYKVINPSNFDISFAWAPHTLFNCEDGTEIVLPKSVKRVFSTCSIDNKLGKFGFMHSWPVTDVNGQEYDIAKAYPEYPACEKYYAMGKMEEGWCALHHTVTGDTVGLSYPVDRVPYLGIWEGTINGSHVTALEPCTGDLDFLDTAIQWNRVCTVKACSEYGWYLNLTFDTANKINYIDNNGLIY